MLQDFPKRLLSAQSDGEIGRHAPFRHGWVERDARGFQLVAQWFEKPSQQGFSTATRQSWNADLEMDRRDRKLRLVPGLSGQCRPKGCSQCHAQKGRSYVGAVVD